MDGSASTGKITSRSSWRASPAVDLPDDGVADVRGITYRVMSTVLRRNTAYIVAVAAQLHPPCA
ncbi:hypothetical protein [Streptosporangium roseum]|uniref:hypothetical protein n=1 Tax=Streptosporangium roseum TaxID=2001 RepID=UPI0022AF64E1|nr:hypothetical protein [Streptosporangium roseum]